MRRLGAGSRRWIGSARFLRGALVGGIAGAALAAATVALGGSGVGATFNLGQLNSVNATSALTGSSSGPQLKVVNTNTSNGAMGIYGHHPTAAGSAPAIRGDSDSTAGGAFAIYGLLSSGSPGPGSSAIRARSNSLTANGYGLWASQAGSGAGVLATSATGIGAYGKHTATSGVLPGIQGESAAAGAPGILARNTGGGPALALLVNAGEAPFTVNSQAKVINLNADQLDGIDSTGFVPVNGTAANAGKLGGFDAATFYRMRADPAANAVTILDHAGLTGNVGERTAATIGSDGLGLIGYYDATNHDLKVAHCDNTACSSATKTTLDSEGIVGRYTSITIGADGLGLISYYDVTNADLKVAHCTNNAICSAATRALLDINGARDVGTDNSVTIGVDGLGLISYYDITNGDLKVAHCSNVACSSASLTTVASAGDVGRFTSITIGADGLGLITYASYFESDPPSGFLHAAHCTRIDCSAATTGEALDGTLVGAYNSVAIGPDGLGVISYFNARAQDLKVAHCQNLACSSATNATLDSAGDVGIATSATVGADGFGLVSYVDMTNQNLKVLHCASAFCTPYFRRR